MRCFLAGILMLAGLVGASAAPAVLTVTDLPYGDLPRQKLDLYLPAGEAGDGPVLVFFYGGGWERGAKQDLAETATSLAASGMIVAVPDYRLYPQAVFPQFVEDCAKAVSYVWQSVRRPDGSARRLFVGGHSAGAFNAVMLAADERYLAAAGVPSDAVAGYVLLSGPYNMGGYLPAPYAAIFPAPDRDRADANAFVDGGEAPVLLMTVDADDVVDPRNTDRLAATVMAHGGRAIVATYKGSDHIATFRGLSHPASAVRTDLAAFILAVSAQ